MSSFSRFIIDQRLASEAEVLDAIVTSIASQPKLCTVVYEQKLLSTKDQMRAIEYQSAHSVTYQQALSDLGLWNDDIAKTVAEHTSRSTTPFSTVLVDKQITDFPSIIRAFDEFIATSKSSTPSLRSVETKQKFSDLPHDSGSSTNPISNFAQCFDIARYGLMTSMINDWNSFPPESRAQVIHAIIAEWDAIRIAAESIGASETAALLEAGIYMLQNNSSTSENINAGQIAHLTTIALNVTHIAWALRERMLKSNNLYLTTEDSALKFRYETILSAVRTIRAAA